MIIAILAGLLVMALLIAWSAIRIAAAEDREELTRWNREAAHVQHNAALDTVLHGLN